VVATVQVTIVGPGGEVSLAVPEDAPLERLLPTLVSVAAPGSDRSIAWTIASPSHPDLGPGKTLAQCGVVDGARLLLEAAEPEPAAAAGSLPSGEPHAPAVDGRPEAPDEPEPEPPPATGNGSPLRRSRDSLPPRVPAHERLREAALAAVHPAPLTGTGTRTGQDQTSNRGRGAGPQPGAMTIAQSTTPYERAQTAWRRTDYRRRLDDAIAAPRLRRCPTIAVVSPKGGVGKTTLAVLMGSLLAKVRSDRVVAVDTNPDYGSLGWTLTPDHDVFADDMLELLDRPDVPVTELDAHLGRSQDGLMVLPAPVDSARASRLDRNAYRRLIEHLQMRAGILLLDCGTGLHDPPAQAAVMCADQMVLVTDAEPATATLVAEASKRLLRSGAPLTLVVNKLPRNTRLDLDELSRAVSRAAGMATVEDNPVAATRVSAGEFSWEEGSSGPWATTVRELVAGLVAGWPGLGLTSDRA
jgi:MinD-like ATPase involved in chromosome partitioning or flagellar assembly